MGQLSRQAGKDAAGFLRAIGAARDPAAFARAGVAALPGIVPSELTTLSVCDLATGRRRVVGNPGEALTPGDIAAFDRHFFLHPLVRFHRGHPRGGAHRISDSLTAAEFRNSALYSDYYRRIGIDRAVAVPILVSGATLVSFVLNRKGRDFSDDEITLLDWLCGGLSDLYRNVIELQRAVAAMAELRTIAEADGWTLVRLDGERRVRDLPARAAVVLADACPGRGLRSGGPLPPAIDAWLRRSTAGGAPWLALPPLVLAAPRGRVTLRAVPEFGNGLAWTLLVRHEPCQRTAAGGGTLTRREQEILAWVAAGKADRQIAAIVGSSVRTVQKHLEHVYVKLGVENRTAAAMRARADAAGQSVGR